MNHSQLRAFHAVAQEGSFTRAAETLRVSQPTLSGHVRALEEGYGVELFERRGRSIRLTEFGRSLLEVTERYFATEEEAAHLLSTAKGLLQGRLNVSADSPFYVVPLLAAFSRRFPAVKRSLSFGNSQTVLRDLLARACDVGIVAGVEVDARVHTVPIYRDRLVVFVNHGHIWAQQRSIRLADLAEHIVLLRERGSTTRMLLEAALEKRGVRLGETLELGSREAIREAAAEGLGVGVVNEAEVGRDDRLHKLDIRDAAITVTEYAACLIDRRQAPEVAAFLDLAEEMAKV